MPDPQREESHGFSRVEDVKTPDVDRTTARRLGGAAMLCGFLLVPPALAIWTRADADLAVGLALGGSVVGLLAVAFAYR
jgi:hypothetical protein